jgi:hypothetical protein
MHWVAYALAVTDLAVIVCILYLLLKSMSDSLLILWVMGSRE